MSTRAHARTATPLSRELYNGLQQVAHHNASAHGSGTGTPFEGRSTISPSLISPFGQADYQYATQSAHSSRPQTPNSTASDKALRTRSGRTILRTSSPITTPKPTSSTRISKPPRVKASKPKTASSIASKVPHLDRPLSQIEGMDSIPVRDMEAWVHRPISVRQEEVEKRNGYVTRPMNSFMLYRSAYAERTKAWCVQNNHQIVSSVSGASWPMEPEEVKEFYNRLAALERDNHAKAHPSYKFSPSKGGAAAKKKGKRKGEESDIEDDDDDDVDASSDEYDPEEQDAEYRPRGGRSSTRGGNGRSASGPRQMHQRDNTTYPASYASGSMPQGQHLQVPRNQIIYDNAPHLGNPDMQMHLSPWAAAAPSTHQEMMQQDFYDQNLSFFAPGQGLQQETPYYSLAGSSSYGAGAGPSQYEIAHLHSNSGTPLPMQMGMQMQYQGIPMHPMQFHGSVPVHFQPQMQHMSMHTIPQHQNQVMGFNGFQQAPTFQQETQIDPMILQMEDEMIEQEERDAEGENMEWGGDAEWMMDHRD